MLHLVHRLQDQHCYRSSVQIQCGSIEVLRFQTNSSSAGRTLCVDRTRVISIVVHCEKFHGLRIQDLGTAV